MQKNRSLTGIPKRLLLVALIQNREDTSMRNVKALVLNDLMIKTVSYKTTFSILFLKLR
jgi:hypothetical protein